MQKKQTIKDVVYKQPGRFSLRLALPQAALFAALLIAFFTYLEFKNLFVLCVVVFLPVLSVVVFANFTRRYVYVLRGSERTLTRFVQWYWFPPGQIERHNFSDIAEVSVVRYDGEETWWLVQVVLRDGRRFELTGDRNRDKSDQVKADIEQLVGCPANAGNAES